MRMVSKCKNNFVKDSNNNITRNNLFLNFQNDIYSTYLATQNRPNYARKIFPCFDEPAFKVPYTFSLARPENYTTLFISPVDYTEQM